MPHWVEKRGELDVCMNFSRNSSFIPACNLIYSKVKQSEKEATFIHRMFAGKLRSRVTCESCKSTSDTFENFLDLRCDDGLFPCLVTLKLLM